MHHIHPSDPKIFLSWTWSAYFNLVQKLAAQILQEMPNPPCHTLRLRTPSLEQGLLGLGVATHLGLRVLFDEKGRQSSAMEGVWDCPLELFWPAESQRAVHLYPSSADEAPPFCAEKLRVSFSTSVGTGGVTYIPKDGHGLCAEVEELRELFGLREGHSVLSFVRPFHSYGFLHALLLPLRARCSLTLWPTPSLTHDLSQLPLPCDLLVAVPSQWNLIQYALENLGFTTLVSSGANFGQQRRRELALYRQNYAQAYEILGSTETSGIGFRSLDGEEGDYQLFAGVRIIDSSDAGTWLESPFVAPETEAFTSDQLEAVEASKIRHRGRADRIFKHGSKRYSLLEIEKALSAICDGALVACHYTEDFSRAQGGTLRAWVETLRSYELSLLRVRFLAVFDLPFPQRLMCVPQLPRDGQGQLQLHELMQDA